MAYFNYLKQIAVLLFVIFSFDLSSPLKAEENDKKYADYARSIYSFVQKAQYKEAEKIARKMIASARRERGEHSLRHADALSWMGFLYKVTGRIYESAPFFEKAVKIYEKAPEQNNRSLATALNNLGTVRHDFGRYKEAESLYKRAISLHEMNAGKGAETADPLINLAKIYNSSGRADEAIALIKRAQKIRTRIYSQNHPLIASTLQILSKSFEIKNKYAEAEKLLRRAVEIRKQSQHKLHPELAGSMDRLASNLFFRGKYRESERIFRVVIRMRRAEKSTSPLDLEASLKNSALNLRELRQFKDAEKQIQESIAILKRVFPGGHPRIASRYALLAEMQRLQKKYHKALANIRKSTASIFTQRTLFDVERLDLQRHLGILWITYLQSGRQLKQAIAMEALEVAQRATQTETSDAVRRMGVRFSTNNSDLADLVKKNDNLFNEQKLLNIKLTRILGLDASRRGKRKAPISKRLQYIEKEKKKIEQELKSRFPKYFNLTKPSAMSLQAIQAYLKPDQAVIKIIPGYQATYTFVITRHGLFWRQIQMTVHSLKPSVILLKKQLDELDLDNVQPDEGVYSLKRAYDLYNALLRPMERHFVQKKQLVFIPSGPLSSLPLHVLVRRKPRIDNPTSQQLAEFRRVDWLITRHSISVLPSLTSLKFLKNSRKYAVKRKPIIGFANPLFNKRPVKKTGKSGSRNVRRSTGAQSYAAYWEGAAVDLQLLRENLAPLPGTEAEIRTVASYFKADAADILLGKSATEARVKSVSLSQYKIVYFATHGLIAGEAEGLGEPGLVLSIPRKASAIDDGILTASEITQLTMNADWVVLSACNTGSGDSIGAEGLSGLARSFFYAGARALLVSHWSVYTNAATRLTTKTFEFRDSSPQTSRAEALRLAMLDFLEDKSSPWNAHPSLWGGFSIIGVDH